MNSSIAIAPIGAFRTRVRPPGSKSLTNRALLLAALAKGRSVLHHPLYAEDTLHMQMALRQLGFPVHAQNGDDTALQVEGKACRIPPATGQTIHLGNAGTAYRFLTAACCLGEGRYVLDGIERMRQRPIGQLVDALRQIGGHIRYLNKEGFPPLEITGGGLQGGELVMPPTLSSQYISALLQVGPCCSKGLTLRFDGPVTSRPYVQMTISLMQQFGAKISVDDAFTCVRVEPISYLCTHYDIEPDASSASYFLAAAAITPDSSCTIQGLGSRSLQGDIGFADLLHQMGADLIFGGDFITIMAPPGQQKLRGIDVDLNHMPDMALTLATVALFAAGPTAIRNVGNLRVKETDRLTALSNELTKLGAEVEVDGDDLFITPPADGRLKPAAIDTYNDHRMAMSFAVVGLRSPGIVINDPECVQKTFPDFFDYLASLERDQITPQVTP